jgi:hypothetical protein
LTLRVARADETTPFPYQMVRQKQGMAFNRRGSATSQNDQAGFRANFSVEICLKSNINDNWTTGQYGSLVPGYPDST